MLSPIKQLRDFACKNAGWLGSFVILLAVGCVYCNATHGPFIFDDLEAIVSNPVFENFTFSKLVHLSKGTLAGRPLTALTFALNRHFSGLQPEGYHLTNILIHGLNAVLIFSILRRVLGTEREGVSFLTAFLWSIHPLLSEAVNYTVQRTELLMSFFVLTSFYAALRAFGSRGNRQILWYGISVLACYLGVASKEVAAVIPLGIFLFDWIQQKRSMMDVVRSRLAYYFFLLSSWSILRFLLIHGQLRTNTSGLNVHMSSWLYAKTQAGVILHYLKLFFWPNPLVIDYDDWPLANDLVPIIPAALLVVFLVLLSLFLLFKGKSVSGYAGFMFFLILAPTSSVVPIVTEVVAERRMYLPSFFLMLLLLLGMNFLIEKLVRNLQVRLVTIWLMVILSSGFLLRATWARNEQYESDLGIWLDAVGKRPLNARAHVWLGFSYATRGSLSLAQGEFETATRIQPDNEYAHNALADLLALQGRDQEALYHFSEVTRIKPGFSKPYLKMGEILQRRGDLLGAIKLYKEAVRLDPSDVQARTLLENAALLHLRQKLAGSGL